MKCVVSCSSTSFPWLVLFLAAQELLKSSHLQELLKSSCLHLPPSSTSGKVLFSGRRLSYETKFLRAFISFGVCVCVCIVGVCMCVCVCVWGGYFLICAKFFGLSIIKPMKLILHLSSKQCITLLNKKSIF